MGLTKPTWWLHGLLLIINTYFLYIVSKDSRRFEWLLFLLLSVVQITIYYFDKSMKEALLSISCYNLAGDKWEGLYNYIK